MTEQLPGSAVANKKETSRFMARLFIQSGVGLMQL